MSSGRARGLGIAGAMAAMALAAWLMMWHVDSKPTSVTRVLRVAAASDLKFVLDDINSRFHETQDDVRVGVTYAASGTLFAQIRGGAPFDLFLSADQDYARALIDAGLADADSEFRYAIGHLVLWVPRNSALDVDREGIKILLKPGVKKIAIANPRVAPYGRAATAALRGLGVYDQIETKLVLGENVAQAAQFVQSGGADAGILSQSLARIPAMKDEGKFWVIPPSNYPPLIQSGVVLNGTENQTAASQYRSFILGDIGRQVFREHGFSLPEN